MRKLIGVLLSAVVVLGLGGVAVAEATDACVVQGRYVWLASQSVYYVDFAPEACEPGSQPATLTKVLPTTAKPRAVRYTVDGTQVVVTETLSGMTRVLGRGEMVQAEDFPETILFMGTLAGPAVRRGPVPD